MLDVDRVLAGLTLQEKASLTSGADFWTTVAIPRLGVPGIVVADGPHGLRTHPRGGEGFGLGASIPATCFPTASALASSWNPALLRQVGEALGREARALGVSVLLGPGINMKRSPLCGRNFEYFSEDPHLAGELAVGMVEGIQSRGVGTSVKHFAANNQETDRVRVDAQVDERTLREIYLPAFERVVSAAQPWTVMCSYNKVNGVSASENRWLLTTVLREEFGFTGLVMSDWGAVYHRVPALQAGLDLEMPPAVGRSVAEVIAAVDSGELPVPVLDERARAVLELAGKGMDVLGSQEPFDVDDHHRLARQAAAESIVLLHNDGLLPLAPQAKVAVVGEFARTPRFQGGGSSQVNPTRVDALLDELRAVHGDVAFAPGYSLGGDADPEALVAEACAVAAAADAVVLVIGLSPADESEGFDRTHMDLPLRQRSLVRAVAAVNPALAVVVVNGSSVVLGEVTPHARAVVEAWLAGQAAGGAVADVLTGAVNPSGRLAESIPHRLQDNSSFLNFPGDSQVVRYGEGVFIGYRGYDQADVEVAFPFGFGLSYTTFALSDLTVDVRGRVADGTLAASVGVTVTNTGSRDGAEVVQVYVSDTACSVARPPRELKGFAKVFLPAGSAQRVVVELDQRAFSFYSVRHGRWVVEAGEFVVGAGRHSRDLPLARSVVVDAPSLAGALDRDSSLQEWFDDPRGRRLLELAVGPDRASEVLDAGSLAVLGNMPMSMLANFQALGVGHDDLDAMVAGLARGADSAGPEHPAGP